MSRADVLAYVREQYGTEPDHPWADNNAVLRHADSGKWYGLIIEIAREKMQLEGEGMMDILNLKCEPLLIGALRQRSGFRPAWHMNKEQWITILLDGSVPMAEIAELIDLSYTLTEKRKRRRMKNG